MTGRCAYLNIPSYSNRSLYVAAAFATASSLFRMFASVTGDQKDAAYADLLLSHGVQLYSCSKTINFSKYQFSVPTVKDIYASTGMCKQNKNNGARAHVEL